MLFRSLGGHGGAGDIGDVGVRLQHVLDQLQLGFLAGVAILRIEHGQGRALGRLEEALVGRLDPTGAGRTGEPAVAWYGIAGKPAWCVKPGRCGRVLAKLPFLGITQASILQKGCAATSIDEVIAEAGITKSGFFQTFRDKNELAKALLQRYIAHEIGRAHV